MRRIKKHKTITKITYKLRKEGKEMSTVSLLVLLAIIATLVGFFEEAGAVVVILILALLFVVFCQCGCLIPCGCGRRD